MSSREDEELERLRNQVLATLNRKKKDPVEEKAVSSVEDDAELNALRNAALISSKSRQLSDHCVSQIPSVHSPKHDSYSFAQARPRETAYQRGQNLKKYNRNKKTQAKSGKDRPNNLILIKTIPSDSDNEHSSSLPNSQQPSDSDSHQLRVTKNSNLSKLVLPQDKWMDARSSDDDRFKAKSKFSRYEASSSDDESDDSSSSSSVSSFSGSPIRSQMKNDDSPLSSSMSSFSGSPIRDMKKEEDVSSASDDEGLPETSSQLLVDSPVRLSTEVEKGEGIKLPFKKHLNSQSNISSKPEDDLNESRKQMVQVNRVHDVNSGFNHKENGNLPEEKPFKENQKCIQEEANIKHRPSIKERLGKIDRPHKVHQSSSKASNSRTTQFYSVSSTKLTSPQDNKSTNIMYAQFSLAPSDSLKSAPRPKSSKTIDSKTNNRSRIPEPKPFDNETPQRHLASPDRDRPPIHLGSTITHNKTSSDMENFDSNKKDKSSHVKSRVGRVASDTENTNKISRHKRRTSGEHLKINSLVRKKFTGDSEEESKQVFNSNKKVYSRCSLSSSSDNEELSQNLSTSHNSSTALSKPSKIFPLLSLVTNPSLHLETLHRPKNKPTYEEDKERRKLAKSSLKNEASNICDRLIDIASSNSKPCQVDARELISKKNVSEKRKKSRRSPESNYDPVQFETGFEVSTDKKVQKSVHDRLGYVDRKEIEECSKPKKDDLRFELTRHKKLKMHLADKSSSSLHTDDTYNANISAHHFPSKHKKRSKKSSEEQHYHAEDSRSDAKTFGRTVQIENTLPAKPTKHDRKKDDTISVKKKHRLYTDHYHKQSDRSSNKLLKLEQSGFEDSVNRLSSSRSGERSGSGSKHKRRIIKSLLESGESEPRFESNLDERIGAIKMKNVALLKRQEEIEKDKKRYG